MKNVIFWGWGARGVEGYHELNSDKKKSITKNVNLSQLDLNKAFDFLELHYTSVVVGFVG